MECIICEAPATHVIEKRMGHYRDETVEVMSEFFRCEICKEEYFSPEQMRQHNRAVKNEIRRKYALLSPEEISGIRKKLKMTQEELENLLGTGPKVVVRWESGKVIQGRGHDNLLRLLDREPGLVEILHQIQRARADAQETYENARQSPKGQMVAQAV